MNIGLRLRLSRRKRVGTGESKVVQSVRRLRRNHLEDSFNQNRDRPARLVGGKTFWRGQFKSIRCSSVARSVAGRHFSRFQTKVSRNRDCRRSYSVSLLIRLRYALEEVT